MSLERSQDTRTTTRKPLSDPMLVRCGTNWQVCYKARGSIDDRKVTAWVYGPASIFFCEVGKEDQVCDLPKPSLRPFFDDQFVHMIEELDENGTRLERLAGANDIIAANAAWQVITTNRRGILVMRDGSRVVRRRE